MGHLRGSYGFVGDAMTDRPDFNHTEQQEYEEWINDPVAQAEYQKWRIQDELRRAGLPDPMSASFVEAFTNFFKDSK